MYVVSPCLLCWPLSLFLLSKCRLVAWGYERVWCEIMRKNLSVWCEWVVKGWEARGETREETRRSIYDLTEREGEESLMLTLGVTNNIPLRLRMRVILRSHASRSHAALRTCSTTGRPPSSSLLHYASSSPRPLSLFPSCCSTRASFLHPLFTSHYSTRCCCKGYTDISLLQQSRSVWEDLQPKLLQLICTNNWFSWSKESNMMLLPKAYRKFFLFHCCFSNI